MNTINIDIINFVLNNHKPGIIAFSNEVDQKILIVYRKSCIDGITEFLKDIKLGSYKYKDLEQDFNNNKITINILETFDTINDNDLKLQHTKYVNLYSSYKHYNNGRKALVYKLRKFIDVNTGLIHVQLVNKANKKITVGIFSDFELSEKFVLTYYSGQITKVVYDNSKESITQRYKESGM